MNTKQIGTFIAGAAAGYFFRDQIAGQILALSTERTGLEIKKLPEHFFTKIESLIETIGHTTQSPIVYLNPSDLQSIEAIVEEQ